jgi:hypothetical protein
MWVMLSDSFLSIVSDPKREDTLTVRARMKGDIERVFPRARVYATPERDYGFRAYINRTMVASAIAAQVRSIKYGNFKDSVKNVPRHNAYLDVWTTMMRWARGLPRTPQRNETWLTDFNIDDDTGQVR